MKMKKLLSMFLVMAITLPYLGVMFPGTTPTANAAVSQVWATPELPPGADEVNGVQNASVLLNSQNGGAWKFAFTPPTDAPKIRDNRNYDFDKWDEGIWKNVSVPGQILMQGYDILNEKEYFYKSTVNIPADYSGKRVILRFDGVYSLAGIWIDGVFVKQHQGGFTTWDADITNYVQGKQSVELVVGFVDELENPSAASVYAHQNVGGILRDVTLMALPKDYIKRVYINTELDGTYQNAVLSLRTEVGMVSDNSTVEFELIAPNGDKVDIVPSNLTFNKSDKEKILEIPITNPLKWDAEHPNLYILKSTLKVNGEVLQVSSEEFGFREITYGGKDGTDSRKVYVNGKEVKLRGTCRHDVSFDKGRSTTAQEDYEEVAGYKAMNINYVRTSHYPPSEAFLDACDKIGIYVEEETAVCFQDGYKSTFKPIDYFMEQFTDMVERDRNRPSVLIWSLGNESQGSLVGPQIEKEYDYIKSVDLTRLVKFSFNTTLNTRNYDIHSEHYAGATGSTGMSGTGLNSKLTKPILHDEYAHIACYNKDEINRDSNVRNQWGESIKIFWEKIFETDGQLGGALWGGIDEVFYIPEGTSERHQNHSQGDATGYGEWGSVFDVYRRFKPEAYLTKKAYSPIRIADESIFVPEENEKLIIPIKNWFDHTNLDEVKMEWSVNGETNEMLLPSISPHQSGNIEFPDRDWILGETLNLKFYTTYDGLLVDEFDLRLGKMKVVFESKSDTAPTVTDEADTITVTGNDFSVKFDKLTAQIKEAKLKDDVLITGGPYIHFTGTSLDAWKADSITPISTETKSNSVLITLLGKYGNFAVKFEIDISSNGAMSTKYTFLTAPPVTSGYSEYGLSFDINHAVESVSWLREGLWSVYPEDHIGRNEGTAYLKRAGSETNPDQYGIKPTWAWKDDMKNMFINKATDANDGLATNDFKALRENIWLYNANFKNTTSMLRVESDTSEAARIEVNLYNPNCIDDRDSRLVYTGSWGKWSDSGDFGGTESFSNAAGATCELTFEGTGIKFFTKKQSNTGKVKIYIDGEQKTIVETNSSIGSPLLQQNAYTIDNLEFGAHTIKVEAAEGAGKCTVIDYFEIIRDRDISLRNRLIVNKEWSYPNIGWGNYIRPVKTLAVNETGTVNLRLTDRTDDYVITNDVVVRQIVLSNFKITKMDDGSFYANYDIQNGTDADLNFQWYKKNGSTFEKIENATSRKFYPELGTYICKISAKTEGAFTEISSNELFSGVETDIDDLLGDQGHNPNPDISFTGSTIHDRNDNHAAAFYKKSISYIKGGSVSFTFTGEGIRWVGHYDTNHGAVTVNVDGVETTVNQYGTKVWAPVTMFEMLNLGEGEHTITLTNKDAAYMNVDKFVILNPYAITTKIDKISDVQKEDEEEL